MTISQNIRDVINNIPKDVQLLAVSKTKSIEEMEEAYSFGLRDFGENKVQEIVNKSEVFHKDVRWHMIGNLQTNKVKYLVGKVYLIHSLSSIKLLEKIEKEFAKKNEVANVLIQVNIGREESKGGFYTEELEEAINLIEKCKFVKVFGLMTIIPKGDTKDNRNYFKRVKIIFDDLKEREFKNIRMDILSMGMTHDYVVAIQEGSTLVRVGEGIFGKRNYYMGGNKNE